MYKNVGIVAIRLLTSRISESIFLELKNITKEIAIHTGKQKRVKVVINTRPTSWSCVLFDSLSLTRMITTIAKKAANGLSVRFASIQRKIVGETETPKTTTRAIYTWFVRCPTYRIAKSRTRNERAGITNIPGIPNANTKGIERIG
jgi:hypothetical protein